MRDLIFDERSHTYTWRGHPVPGVTQILREGWADPIDESHWTEYARSRGSAVHRAITLLESGDLDWSTVDPAVQPYVDTYVSFRRSVSWIVYATERQVYCRSERYAGTLDLYGKLNGRRAIIDIKTGRPSAWASAQVAAYLRAARECRLRPQCGYVLELRAGASFCLHAVDFERDYGLFLAALRRRENLLKEDRHA